MEIRILPSDFEPLGRRALRGIIKNQLTLIQNLREQVARAHPRREEQGLSPSAIRSHEALQQLGQSMAIDGAVPGFPRPPRPAERRTSRASTAARNVPPRPLVRSRASVSSPTTPEKAPPTHSPASESASPQASSSQPSPPPERQRQVYGDAEYVSTSSVDALDAGMIQGFITVASGTRQSVTANLEPGLYQNLMSLGFAEKHKLQIRPYGPGTPPLRIRRGNRMSYTLGTITLDWGRYLYEHSREPPISTVFHVSEATEVFAVLGRPFVQARDRLWSDSRRWGKSD